MADGQVPRHRALVVVTPTAASGRTTGASLRVCDVAGVLEEAGFQAEVTTASGLDAAGGDACLGVAVSYAGAGAVRALRRRAPAVWLDAVDSWLLVDRSGLRARRASYAARMLRDAVRLAAMPTPDLVTYISDADRQEDGPTVRARRRLVLPGSPVAPVPQPSSAPRRLVLAGDWAYPPNRDGLAWFTRRCLPLLEEALAGARWSVTLYGPHAPALPPRIQVVGYVADEADLYRVGDVHLAPVLHGAGVKRKVLSPLLAGLPVVTTPAGAHGLLPSALLDVCSAPEDFATATARRLASPSFDTTTARASFADADETAAVRLWLHDIAVRCERHRAVDGGDRHLN